MMLALLFNNQIYSIKALALFCKTKSPPSQCLKLTLKTLEEGVKYVQS